MPVKQLPVSPPTSEPRPHNWHVGDLWLIAFQITNTEELLVDPTAVAVTITAPNGTKTTPLVVKIEVGIYETNAPVTEDGPWHGLVLATGNYQAAQPFSIRVQTD